MATQASGSESYVLFELAGATYALRSDSVVQLDMVAAPTPVPNAPPFVEGVVSVRGQVIPAVSLRTRFGFERTEHDLRSRLIVVRSQERTVGLVVDSAREFASIPPDGIKPLPEGIGGASRRYLHGVAQRGDRLVLVVDVPQLLALDVLPTDPAPPPSAFDAAPDGAST